MDAGSEGYYAYYYVSFTQQERKQLKELFGRDLFAKGFSGKDLTEEQVQRILTRITPSLKQWLKTRDILPFLKQRYVLTDTETLHLKSGSLRSQEQAVRLVEFLMNKGSYGIAALYLCLIESSEQLSGLPAHYQLAGQLKQIVQTECGVCQVVPLGVRGEDDDQPSQSLYLAVENLCGIPLTPETSQAFIINLGFSTEEFHTIPTDLLSVCKLWMDKRSTCYMEELVEALVHTQGLGRYTTQLCSHRNGNLVELRNFFISLGDKWQDVAKYLGFSAEEIQELVHPQPDNTEIQVTKFLQVWQLPDCGQRILPLMHKLKSLAGIVEPRNPSRRLDDRPGTLGYMNRHLKTDITGIPHRSLDTYTHTSTHPPASSHLHTANPSIREPAHPTSPSYSRHTHSDHSDHSHTTLLLIFHEQPHTYDSHESHMPNSNWTDIGDQEPVIEELSDDDSTTTTPAKKTAPAPPPKSSHSEVSLQPASYQATVQDQRLNGKEVEARRVVPPGVTQQGLYGNEVLPGSSQAQPQQGQLFGNEVFPTSNQPQGQLFGNEVFPSTTQSQGQLFGNEVFGQDTKPLGQLFGNEVFPNSVQPQGQLFGNEVLPGDDGSLQRQPFGNEMERNGTVGEAVMQEETNDFGNMNSQPSQPENDLHSTDISAPDLTTARLPSSQPLTSSTQQAFPNELVSSQPLSLSSQANNLSSDADSVQSEAEMLAQSNLSNSSQVHIRNQLTNDQALQETTERADSMHNSTSGSTPSPIRLDEFASLESREHGDIVERDDISRDNTTNGQETCGPDVINAIEDPEGLEMLTALVASGANINLPTEDGAYPIHHVVSSGNPEKMLLLLNNNANVNAARSDGKTPLHVACIKQDFPMVQILVERGANTAAQDQQGFTCLHYKETLESCDIVIYLVHNGTPVDAPSKESYLTPLLVCCFAGEKTLEAAEHLITNNACVNGSPMSHMKPLITASNEGHVRMVKLLLDKGADVNLSDQDGNTALLRACLNDHLEVARQLCQGRPDINVNTPNKEELTPLMVAVTNSNLELAGILISHGANVNCSRVSKFNLAGMEMPVQMTPLADASARGRLEIVQALVENKAEVNALSENAFPPIAFAVLGGHTNVVEYLLKQNDLDASLNGLSKPFVLAVKCQNHQCAELLITRYRGMERLLEDAKKNNMHELVEHIQKYKQMAANPQSGLVQQLAAPNPPPVTQATPPTTIAQQQLPQRQQPQQQLPQQQLPQQMLQQPPPTIDEYSPQEEQPLNDFSDEALNQLNDEPSQQYQMQTRSQQTLVNNLNQLPSNGATREPGVPNPVASQQTAAEPHPKQPLLQPGSQGTPQQTNFVKETQPNGSLLPPPNGSTSQHTSTQHVQDMPFQQSTEVGKTQTDTTGVTETSGEDVDKSLFAPQPRSPPPASSPEHHPQHHPQHHPLPTVELQTPDELQHSMVEVLHEFAQICISAAVRHKGHEWLVDKAASTGYSHLLEFFWQYFDNSAVFARDGKLVAEFIGGAPSPLNFLLAGRLVTREDFESVLKDIGRPKFVEQLMMALHQFPGSEHLPWTPSGLMDALFNQHFSIGSNFPNPSSLRAPSPPPPQPVNLQSKTNHEFPETGGHRLGRGEDEKPNEPTQQPIASQETHTGQTSATITDHSSSTSATASLGTSLYMPMSNVISLDTPVSSFVPPAAALNSLESTGDELNDLSVLDDEEPITTETPSTGTTLPLPSIQQQSLPIIPPPVTQATREGINPPPTTKPQLSDSSIVQTTAAPLSSKVVPSGPHATTNTISSSGKTDQHKEKFQSKPSIPSPQQHLASLPTFSVAPMKPQPTQPLSLDDSSKPAASLAGGHTTVNQSLPGRSHPPTPKTTARETPVKALKTTQTTPVMATPPSTHATSVPAKAPSTKPVNSKTASPPTRRKDPLTVAKTPGRGTPGVPSKTAETTHKAARQSRLPVLVKHDSPSPVRSTSTESLTQARPIRGSTKKTSRNTVQRPQTERKQKQVAGPEKKEASMVAKPAGRRGQAEKSSKTPPVSRKTVASKTTVLKAPPTKKNSGQEKVPSLTSANEETDPENKLITQESFQHHRANPDDHTVNQMEGTLEGLIFSNEPVPDAQDSQLFKIVAQRINKWKILGRYLGLEDETLEAIQRDNHFIVEQCYKMLVTWQQGLRAEATYLKLAQSLKNIMREDLLPELLLCMDQSSNGSESGGDSEGERVLIHIAPSGNPDLQTIKDNFLLQRRKGLKAARITLQYPSLINPQKAPLHFTLPTLDDSSLRVVEELCVAANIREDVKQVQVDIEYIHP